MARFLSMARCSCSDGHPREEELEVGMGQSWNSIMFSQKQLFDVHGRLLPSPDVLPPQSAEVAQHNEDAPTQPNGAIEHDGLHLSEEDLMFAPVHNPTLRGYPIYSMSPKQPLVGVPILEGQLSHFTPQFSFEVVTLQLYINGFSVTTAAGMEVCWSLSPFSHVRNCRFQVGPCAHMKSFKITIRETDPCCYFAVCPESAREADEERSDWVLSISNVALIITDSIMPRVGFGSLSCDPIPGKPETNFRLLAGYLAHQEDAESVSVLFCELNAPKGEQARMVFYEDERCLFPVKNPLIITAVSDCTEYVGINCSCFSINDYNFATRVPSERRLWLRALSNMRVKMQNRAPEPDEEELEFYRESIRECIYQLEAIDDPKISSDPLLRRRATGVERPGGDNDAQPSSSHDVTTGDVGGVPSPVRMSSVSQTQETRHGNPSLLPRSEESNDASAATGMSRLIGDWDSPDNPNDLSVTTADQGGAEESHKGISL